VVIRPLRDGVISEFDITEAMLRALLKKAHGQISILPPRPRVVVGVPSGVTEVEKRAVEDAAWQPRARSLSD
jgi:rod shape-determining protein MreB